MKPGYRIKWTMIIRYSSTDIRKYCWIENDKGESAFIWYYTARFD